MSPRKKKYPDYGENQHVYIPSKGFVFLTAGKVASGVLKEIGRAVEGELLKIGTKEAASLHNAGAQTLALYRNPIERLESCYRDKIKRHYYKGFRSMNIKPGISFNDFAKRVCDIPDDKADGHFRSMSCFYLDSEGDPIFDRLISLSDFGNYYEEIFRAENDGFPPLPPAKTVTRDKPGLEVDPLNKNTLDKLIERYSNDLYLEGYLWKVGE